MKRNTKLSAKKMGRKTKTAPKKASASASALSTKKRAVKAKTNAETVKEFNKSADIIDIILADHKPLKRLIQILKNSDKSFSERRAAFEQFAPLLTMHAKAEEQVLYVCMKEDDDTRIDGLEGDVEHGLADQMVEEAKRTKEKDLWTARVKVLAELVEHHIKEEEEEMLPEFRKNSDQQERIELGQQYIETKLNIRGDGSEKNPAFEPDVTHISAH